MGLGLLLIQTAVNMRQELETEAAKLFVVGTLWSAQSKTTLQWKAICSRWLWWELYHRPKRSTFLMLSNTTCENTGREVILTSTLVCLRQGTSLFAALNVQGVHPLIGTTNHVAFPCAVFSPQDHADSGLPHGPEELPHGRTDVHHAIRKLWVLCTSPFWRGDNVFSLPLSPTISFLSCNPFPVQPSLETCSRPTWSGFPIHSAHVTFPREAKP